jgi:Mg-chelatase subunit ChlD
VKDSITELAQFLTLADSNDQISLEVYGTQGRHEVDLTNNFQTVADRFMEMQAGHYDPYTNMGAGIARAIEELESSRSRSFSRKAMILLTDGRANIGSNGSFSYAGGRAYALTMAAQAAEKGIRIFTVSVGASADIALMQEIADIGSGLQFRATGSIENYAANLEQILVTIGGAKSVELIQ